MIILFLVKIVTKTTIYYARYDIVFCNVMLQPRLQLHLHLRTSYLSNIEQMLFLQMIVRLNRMCTHQTKVKRNGKIMNFDDTWVG